MAGSGTVADQAFITLATNDTYALGALVWGHSLRRVGTTRQVGVMVGPAVSQNMRRLMSDVFDLVTEVNVLDSRDTMNLDLLTRPDLGVTFTKLHCWRLTQYSKCVFMDADTLVLQNIDELFDREELSAAPDAGWPDCFNSGVFVYVPSEATYQKLLHFAVTRGSFDGGDQGLLNMFFSDWATADIRKHLPFIYNVVSQAFYSYLPAFKQFGKNVKVAHFIGARKPWHQTYDTATGQVLPDPSEGHSAEFLQVWWDLFMALVQPYLSPDANTLLRLVHSVVYAHQPFHHHHHHHHHQNSPPSDPPKEEPVIHYEMTTPYQLPDVTPFYHVHHHHEDPPQQPVHVENKPRDQYEYLETFYSEAPMDKGGSYAAPEVVYDVKHFETTWTEYKVSEPEVVADEYKHEGQSQVEHKHCEQGEGHPHTDGKGDQSSDNQYYSTESTGSTEDIPSSGKSDELGIVGSLASLRISGEGLSYGAGGEDPEWQYAWERGQIDYKGRDAFEYIQAQLDATIKAPKKPSPPKEQEMEPPQGLPEPQMAVVAKPKMVVAEIPKPVERKPEPPAAAAPPKPAAAPAPAKPAAKAPEPAKPAPKAAEPAKPATKAPEPAKVAPRAAEPLKPAAKAPEPAKPAPKAPEPAKAAPKAAEPPKPAAKAPEPAKAVAKAPEPAKPAAKAPEPAKPAAKAPEPAKPAAKAPEPAKPAPAVAKAPEPAKVPEPKPAPKKEPESPKPVEEKARPKWMKQAEPEPPKPQPKWKKPEPVPPPAKPAPKVEVKKPEPAKAPAPAVPAKAPAPAAAPAAPAPEPEPKPKTPEAAKPAPKWQKPEPEKKAEPARPKWMKPESPKAEAAPPKRLPWQKSAPEPPKAAEPPKPAAEPAKAPPPVAEKPKVAGAAAAPPAAAPGVKQAPAKRSTTAPVPQTKTEPPAPGLRRWQPRK